MEIFSTYGKIKMIDMPVERMHPHLSKGYAYVEFENPDEAEKALKHMDGGGCGATYLRSPQAFMGFRLWLGDRVLARTLPSGTSFFTRA